MLTGDTILGRGTTVVAHPDGVLGDYLASLRRLRELGELTVLPGHGPELPSAGAAAEHYLAHREARLDAGAGGAWRRAPRPSSEVVETVYADVDRALWPAGDAVGARAARAPAMSTGRGPDRDLPVCGTPTVPGARFCFACGAALPAALGPTPRPSAAS